VGGGVMSTDENRIHGITELFDNFDDFGGKCSTALETSILTEKVRLNLLCLVKFFNWLMED
jgi:hypothetical protein